MNGESSMETYTLPHVKQHQWEFAVWPRELCDNLEGGRGREDGLRREKVGGRKVINMEIY